MDPDCSFHVQPQKSVMSESEKLELDPLLKDLSEKKQIFRRNVVSLATELKDARARLSLQQESCARETLTRQVRHLVLLCSSVPSFVQDEILSLQSLWSWVDLDLGSGKCVCC